MKACRRTLMGEGVSLRKQKHSMKRPLTRLSLLLLS